MAVRVHGHKAGVLQEAWVDAAAGTRKIVWHPVNHVVLEPLIAALDSQVVHAGGRAACVDRATHHRHRQRRGFTPRGHQRDCGQHRHRGLAHTDHMAVAVFALQVADEVFYIVDIVVQVEFTFRQRHQTGVFPVGDVDLVVLEHGAHGVTQKRCVVAGQRRHHQHHWLCLELGEGGRVVRESLETAQFAKGQVDFNALMDGHAHAIDIYGGDVEFRLFIVLAQAVHQIVGGCDALRQRRFCKDRSRVAEQFCSGVGEISKGLHQGALVFVDLVKHGAFLKNVAVQYNSNSLPTLQSLRMGHWAEKFRGFECREKMGSANEKCRFHGSTANKYQSRKMDI